MIVLVMPLEFALLHLTEENYEFYVDKVELYECVMLRSIRGTESTPVFLCSRMDVVVFMWCMFAIELPYDLWYAYK